jgi:hypothetical protein
MDKELFEQLTQSMKEAIAIAKGEMKPSRVFTVDPPEVEAVLGDKPDFLSPSLSRRSI